MSHDHDAKLRLSITQISSLTALYLSPASIINNSDTILPAQWCIAPIRRSGKREKNSDTSSVDEQKRRALSDCWGGRSRARTGHNRALVQNSIHPNLRSHSLKSGCTVSKKTSITLDASKITPGKTRGPFSSKKY